MADCRHPSDPKCGINPYYRQTISTCTTKKGRKSFVTDRMGDGPPTVGVSYFHWGERKQVGHRYWAQSSWVGCCSVSSRFWFRTAEMLIHRDLFLSSISLTISPSFIWRHLCVCSKRHCLGTFHLLFLLIIRLICFSSTPRSTKEKKLFSWNSISEDLKKERNEIVFLPSAIVGKNKIDKKSFRVFRRRNSKLKVGSVGRANRDPTISHRHVQLCNSYIGRCRESIPWLYRSHQQDIWHYSPFFFSSTEVVSYFWLFVFIRFAPLSYLIIYKSILFLQLDAKICRLRNWKNAEALWECCTKLPYFTRT